MPFFLQLFNSIYTYYIAFVISENSTPLRTATKLSKIKLIDFVGLMKIEPTNSFLSITSGVLFESSQTTAKSVIPPRHWISLKKGSTEDVNLALVNS